MDRVVVALLLGLTSAGEHAKQRALEEAFRGLCTDEYVDKSKRDLGWESPPA